MYFAWLEVYTKCLFIAGAFGVATMSNQWFRLYGYEFDERGVDFNRLTLLYSVMLSIWGVVFLSV